MMHYQLTAFKDGWRLPEEGASVNQLYPQPCNKDVNKKKLRQYVAAQT
jgi:hypothetical protein